MIEAYAIGISLAIESNPTAELRAIGEQFDLLNAAIKQTQTSVADLSSALSGIERMGGAAARAWTQAAEAIDRAAAAAKQAGTARPAPGAFPLPPAASGAGPSPAPAVPPSSGPTLPAAAPAMLPPNPAANLPPAASSAPGQAVVPYVAPSVPAPYVSRETGFQMQGQPFTPYGGYSPAAPFRPAPSGGALVPWLPSAAGAGGAGGGREPPNFTMQGGAYDPAGRFPAPAPYEGPDPIPLPRLNPNLPPEEAARRRMPADHELAMASLGFGAIADTLLSGVKSSINTRMGIEEIRANLIAQGFTPKQADQAFESARETQVNTPGSSMKGNLEIISKGMAITQDAENAIKLMPALSRFGVALDAFNQGKQGNALMDALLAGDYRGIFQKINPKTGKEEFDLSALVPFLQNVATADFQTHGIINPGRILQFLRSGGAAARIISDQSLFADSLATQMAMGSSRAGTGLNALAQQFSSFKMSNAALTMLQEMHVVRDFDLKHPPAELGRKLGFGQFQLMPKAFYSPDTYEQARNNPTGFIMDYIGPRLQQWLVKAYEQQIAGRKLSDEDKQKLLHEDLLATWPALASRIPGGKFGAETEGSYALILRDRDARMRMLGFDPETGKQISQPRDFFKLQVENNPQVQVKAFEASLESLQAVLGGPLMHSVTDSLNDVTGAFNSLANVSDQHKELTRWIMDGAVAVGALAAGLGTLTGALFLMRPMKSVFQWLAPGLFDVAGGFKLFAEGTAARAGFVMLGGMLGQLAGLFAAFQAAKFVKGKLDESSDWITTHVLGADPKQLQAIKNFSAFDRSTWKDPNAHWWQAEPKLPDDTATPGAAPGAGSKEDSPGFWQSMLQSLHMAHPSQPAAPGAPAAGAPGAQNDNAPALPPHTTAAPQSAPSMPPAAPAGSSTTAPAASSAEKPQKRSDAGSLNPFSALAGWIVPPAQADTLPPAAKAAAPGALPAGPSAPPTALPPAVPTGTRAASLLELARPIPKANDNADRPFGNLATLSAAPAAPAQVAGHSGPIPVRVVNGRDLAQGVTNHMADELTRPPSGPTQPNLRLTPGYVAAIPAYGG